MRSSEKFETNVSDPNLVEVRRKQILQAAVKLFSGKGYYRTTISDIAREAGISSGLIYLYFKEKEDILCLALLWVVETYEQEIPRRIIDARNPIDRLCKAIRAYCTIVDDMREATLLAYIATKSLTEERRKYVMEGEERSNRIIEDCVNACINERYFQEVNGDLLVYQYVMYCHTWALKYWAFKDKYSIDQYIHEGITLLVKPYLTARRGRNAYKELQDEGV